MWPLSWDKNLVEFLGKPAIFCSLETVKKSGIKEVVIVGNETNINNLKDIGRNLGLKAVVIPQERNLKGQGGAILSAKKYIDGAVLVCNANDFFNLKLYEDILKKTKNSKFDALLVGYKVKDYFPGGYLNVQNGQVLGIVEKPDPHKTPSDMVRIVADYFLDGDELIKSLEELKTDSDSWYEEAIDKMIKDGKKVMCLPYSGTWQFLKYPWHILDIMKHFLSNAKRKISKSAKISPKAIIDGDVVISDGVRIFEGAIVRGPAYIAKRAIIGNYALVRESSIGEGSVVGFASEVTRSYVGKDCWFHTNYIGDSVISDNVSFGSGGITANLRLDETEIYSKVEKSKINTQRNKLGAIVGPNVRIGINTMIMPGVKIGSGSFVSSGVVLSEDLGDNKFCVVRQEHKIIENKKFFKTKDREEFRKKL